MGSKVFAFLIIILLCSSLVIARQPEPQQFTLQAGNETTHYIYDMDGARQFNVNDMHVSIAQFSDFVKVNAVQQKSFFSYHLPTPQDGVLKFVDSKGNNINMQLTNTPQPTGHSYGQFIGKVEQALLEDGEGAAIVKLNVGSSQGYTTQALSYEQAKSEVLASLGMRTQNVDVKDLRIIDAIALDLGKEDINTLKKLNAVQKIWKDGTVNIALDTSVPLINATAVWQLNDSSGNPITGAGITIAIIDTGVDYTHEDLGGCIGEGCKVIGGYDFVNEDDDPMDDQGHGTHVAATAAGNGTLLGVAPGASIVALKVLNSGGSGSFSDIIDAIEHSCDPNGDGNYSDHYDIISMSLGGSGDPDDAMSQAVDEATDIGVVAVIAAGNDGPGSETIGSPGCARKAITVGASCHPDLVGVNGYCDDRIASFSSRGPTSIGGIKPEVVAPGVAICAAQWEDAWSSNACKDSGHVAISGTSMATPHVAGVVALLLQNHDWSAQEVKSALMSTATDLGLPLYTQGAGEINVLRAQNMTFFVDPQTIAFDDASVDANLSEIISITNIGTSTLYLNVSALPVNLNNGSTVDMTTANVSSLAILAGATASINITVQVPSNIEGDISGNILLNASGVEAIVPYSFSIYSTLTVNVIGSKTLYPDIIIHNRDLSYATIKFQDSAMWGFSGDTTTFRLPGGNYTVYAVGDFEDVTTEYMLMEMVEVPLSSTTEITLSMASARPFTLKARSLTDYPLTLYEYEKKFVTYNEDDAVSYHFIDPNYGDRTIYISNRPDPTLDTDVMFRYHGIPTGKDATADGWSRGMSS